MVRIEQYNKEAKGKMREISYLALDVNSAEGLSSGAIESLAGLAREEVDVGVPLFEQMLTAMVDNELGGIDIRLETEFFSDESEFHIGLVTSELISM